MQVANKTAARVTNPNFPAYLLLKGSPKSIKHSNQWKKDRRGGNEDGDDTCVNEDDCKSGNGKKTAANHVEVPITAKNSAVDICVGDGGFAITKDENGKHLEHLQELFSFRIILSEFLTSFRTLKVGGNFVCKIFDCFSNLTNGLLYLATFLFKRVK